MPWTQTRPRQDRTPARRGYRVGPEARQLHSGLRAPRAEEPRPDVPEHDLVGGGEALEDDFAHALAVGPPGGFELVQAGIGELGEGAAAVVLGSAAGDVAEVDEAVDEPGET